MTELSLAQSEGYTPASPNGGPLHGEWRGGSLFICNGTIRVFRLDIDTNPSPDFVERLVVWVCERLNQPPLEQLLAAERQESRAKIEALEKEKRENLGRALRHAALHEEALAKIAALEQERDRIKLDKDALQEWWNANPSLLGRQLEKAQAALQVAQQENARLTDLLAQTEAAWKTTGQELDTKIKALQQEVERLNSSHKALQEHARTLVARYSKAETKCGTLEQEVVEWRLKARVPFLEVSFTLEPHEAEVFNREAIKRGVVVEEKGPVGNGRMSQYIYRHPCPNRLADLCLEAGRLESQTALEEMQKENTRIAKQLDGLSSRLASYNADIRRVLHCPESEGAVFRAGYVVRALQEAVNLSTERASQLIAHEARMKTLEAALEHYASMEVLGPENTWASDQGGREARAGEKLVWQDIGAVARKALDDHKQQKQSGDQSCETVGGGTQ